MRCECWSIGKIKRILKWKIEALFTLKQSTIIQFCVWSPILNGKSGQAAVPTILSIQCLQSCLSNCSADLTPLNSMRPCCKHWFEQQRRNPDSPRSEQGLNEELLADSYKHILVAKLNFSPLLWKYINLTGVLNFCAKRGNPELHSG